MGLGICRNIPKTFGTTVYILTHPKVHTEPCTIISTAYRSLKHYDFTNILIHNVFPKQNGVKNVQPFHSVSKFNQFIGK